MMKQLEENYLEQLDTIAQSIQGSDELAKFMDSEEADDYKRLCDAYEEKINNLYEQLAAEDPAQLIAFENVLLHEAFEGLFLPRVLGFSILRGELDEHCKYIRPQDHFRRILLSISNSVNFEYIKKRIGQSIQMGFALSSDIWITNLIDEIENKKVKAFLKAQKNEQYREEEQRKSAYARYKRQFEDSNYLSAEFPKLPSEMKTLSSSLKQFFLHRIEHQMDMDALLEPTIELLNNKELQATKEYHTTLGLYAAYFELDADLEKSLYKLFNELRVSQADFAQRHFDFLLDMYKTNLNIDARFDTRFASLLDKKIKDDLIPYYSLVEDIHKKGYINENVIEDVRNYIGQHEGVSKNNACIRQVILNYIKRLMKNLDTSEYREFIDTNQVVSAYIRIFNNQQFEQVVKRLYFDYLQKLLRVFVDKRGRDYQIIKKFTAEQFQDLGFLDKRTVEETFKTPRKKIGK